MLNIVVLVSGGGTNLQALIDAQGRDMLGGGRIAAVVSSRPGVYALERAEKAHIPAVVVPRKAYAGDAPFCRALEEALAPFSPDLLVLAGFLSIFDEEFCQKYQNRILNIHPSLIPAFCGKGMYGLRVHQAALAYGVKVTGATVHFVTSEPDGGPIVLQKAVAIDPGDTAETLQKRVMAQCEHVLLPQAVALFCQGRLRVEGRTVTICG